MVKVAEQHQCPQTGKEFPLVRQGFGSYSVAFLRKRAALVILAAAVTALVRWFAGDPDGPILMFYGLFPAACGAAVFATMRWRGGRLLFAAAVAVTSVANQVALFVGQGGFQLVDGARWALVSMTIAAFGGAIRGVAAWYLGRGLERAGVPAVRRPPAVVFPFFYGGQATVGPDTVALRTPVRDLTWAALGFGALLALRFLALGTAGLAFAFTTHSTDLMQGLSRRGWDYRLVHAPVLGLILFPSFLQLGREISITQRIRDLGQDTNWFRRKWIRIRHLAFAMLVLGLRNGQTQAMALDIRGYGAHKSRTFMRELPRHRGGDIFAWAFFALSVIYLIYEFNPATMQWNIGR